ncbi:G-protein coupled receptor Mth [Condylostylus longicornis]|uniref:G-protein coupled receptor Mth n=1 Tax=Condylostylus longicornis TaxID=2530218 RepID=UPI00244E32D3|nr:G-protein coupled receptor Mth [Condylostylus longicornis]
MVRTCNRPSICMGIPCVRRCCQRNEKRVKINGTRICVPDSSHIDIQYKFHDIDMLTNGNLICNEIPCIPRCCKINEKRIKYNGTAICVPDLSNNDIDIIFHSYKKINKEIISDVIKPRVYGTLYGQDCLSYKLDPNIDPRELHLINYKDGSLYLPNEDEQNSFTNSEYCIEKLEGPKSTQVGTFVCFPSTTENTEIKFKIYSVGILISCVFFFLTLLVYICVPKLRNLPGKILICLVSCLLVAYLGIAIGQISPPNNDKLCYSFAFFIYFSMMAAFSWMNIMCFDIWLTFGSTSRPRGNFGNQELKRFLMYSLYGWGMPILITLLTMSVTRFNLVSDDLQPKFGEGRCWFQYAHSKPHLVFFLGPVGILFLFNLILFILTLKYCNQVKKDIQRMQSTNADKPIIKTRFTVDKTRFIMNTKLFIVMGITWILEIISTIFYDQKNVYLWYISDFSNILQGVLVFFVFVFKRRVWYAVLDRFGIKTASARKSTTMATTSTFTGGSSVNLHRLRSMESCSSLLATNATAVNGRSYQNQLPFISWKDLLDSS